MKAFFTGLGKKYLDRRFDFRVRLFNLMAMAGVTVSALMVVTAIAIYSGPGLILANLASTVLSYSLLRYSQKTGRYELCYLITIVAIFLVLFPVIFFTSGGYYSGMPSFFVFAVVFTAFMLTGVRALVLSLMELAVYVGCCLAAWRWPHLVTWFDTDGEAMADVLIGFVTVSVALGLTMYLQLRMYNEQQRLLAERNRELDRINRLKTEFLSNISHELKTPLTVVSSHVQYGQMGLAGHPELADVERRMKLIGSEAERMALMVGQILDVSRIDEGRMAVEAKPDSIVEIIQTALDIYYPVFTKNGNQLAFRREGDVPPVLCDRFRIIQVLVNLIGNASAHTRDDTITVAAAPAQGGVRVTVADNGEGIPPERLARVFERYNTSAGNGKADGKADGKAQTGTGLGLYISKYIIEAHGGAIAIESEPGVGTEVAFTLPAAEGTATPPANT